MSGKPLFALLSFVLVAAGCSALPPAQDAATEPPQVERPSAGPADTAEIAFTALALVGTPYAHGGRTPDTGFDCSGLVAYVFARAASIALPRSTFDLARAGTAVGPQDLRQGDLVFYNTRRRAFSHVGIYLGDARFVHAPSAGGAVRVEDMRLAYWTRRFDGARRLTF